MEAPTTWIGLFFTLGVLLISSIGVWILEYKKHQTYKKQNGNLETIADTLKKLDEKQDEINIVVAETKTKVEEQSTQCKITVKSVFKGIEKNTDRIFKLKGQGGQS